MCYRLSFDWVIVMLHCRRTAGGAAAAAAVGPRSQLITAHFGSGRTAHHNNLPCFCCGCCCFLCCSCCWDKFETIIYYRILLNRVIVILHCNRHLIRTAAAAAAVGSRSEFVAPHSGSRRTAYHNIWQGAVHSMGQEVTNGTSIRYRNIPYCILHLLMWCWSNCTCCNGEVVCCCVLKHALVLQHLAVYHMRQNVTNGTSAGYSGDILMTITTVVFEFVLVLEEVETL